MKKQILIIITLLTISCTSCSTVYQVNTTLEKFVKAFEKEAARWGKNININNLILNYDIANKKNTRATYWQDAITGQKYISINSNEVCLNLELEYRLWQEFMEVLIFHELAHAYLNRGNHINSTIQNRQLSIMHKDTLCRPNNFYIGNSRYREYYMKELFTKEVDVSLLK